MTDHDPYNTPLHQLMGHKNAKKGDLGIEIEAEAPVHSLSPDQIWMANVQKEGKVPKYWQVKGDGSLRNGAEYVSNKPVPIAKLSDAMAEWVRLIEGTKFREDSIRTSVHYHVNVSELTINQITAVIAGWWLIETPIVDTQGPTRVGNLFCLRVSDAEHLVNDTLDAIEQDMHPFLGGTLGDNVKYAACNLNAIRRFGSLEFRFNKGTVDPKRIERWASFLYRMVHNFAAVGSPMEIIRRYELNGAQYIMSLAGADQWLVNQFRGGWVDNVNSNYSYAYMLSRKIAEQQQQEKHDLPILETTRPYIEINPDEHHYPNPLDHPDFGDRYKAREFSFDESEAKPVKIVASFSRKKKVKFPLNLGGVPPVWNPPITDLAPNPHINWQQIQQMQVNLNQVLNNPAPEPMWHLENLVDPMEQQEPEDDFPDEDFEPIEEEEDNF